MNGLVRDVRFALLVAVTAACSGQSTVVERDLSPEAVPDAPSDEQVFDGTGGPAELEVAEVGPLPCQPCMAPSFCCPETGECIVSVCDPGDKSCSGPSELYECLVTESCVSEWILVEDCAPAPCEDAECQCLPQCNGNECGANGCGGWCGACYDGMECKNGQCVLCEPACGSAECGDDGCGGSCGECGKGFDCEVSHCVPCEPDCIGLECGNDGCGGLCGSCSSGDFCWLGECTSCPNELWANAANAGDPDADGTTVHPFPTIQDAVDAALPETCIRVSAGDYHEAPSIDKATLAILGSSTGDTVVHLPQCEIGLTISASDVLLSDLHLVDGEVGVEITGSEESPLSNVVLQRLDIHDLQGCGSDQGWWCDGYGYPASHGIGVSAEHVQGLVLDQVTATNIAGDDCSMGLGLGFRLHYVDNCIVRDCVVDDLLGGTGLDWGSGARGMSVSQSSGCAIEDNVVVNIDGGHGGFYGGGGSATGISIGSLTESTVARNKISNVVGGWADGDAGIATGISVYAAVDTMIDGNFIDHILGGGSNGFGGAGASGVWVDASTGVTVKSNSISEARAGEDWDAFCHAARGIFVEDSTKTLVTGNVMQSIAGGADYSDVDANTAGIMVWQSTSTVLQGNTIRGVWGVCGPDPFSLPYSSPPESLASGILVATTQADSIQISDSVISSTEGFCLYNPNGNDEEVFDVSYSNLHDCGAGAAHNLSVGEGCLGEDPLFVSPETGDLHLQAESPCVDAASPMSSFALEPPPNGCRANMGAYGNSPEATAAPGAAHCPNDIPCTDCCGDTIVAAGEECDDGNTDPCDGCLADCTPSSCGDGFVCGEEQCDDGNDSAEDGCTPACTFTEFGVDQTEGYVCYDPRVSSLADGGFIVVWQNNLVGPEGSDSIRGRRFCKNGLPCTDDVALLDGEAGSVPEVAGLEDEGFVLLWRPEVPPDCAQLLARTFSTNLLVGSDVPVPVSCGKSLGGASVASLPGDGFVVIWEERIGYETDPMIVGQRWGPGGTPAGTPFQVSQVEAFDHRLPVVSSFPDGGFVVAWESSETEWYGPTHAWAQLYAADGAESGANFIVSDEPGNYHLSPRVAAGANGEFVTVWTEDPYSSGETWNVKGVVVSADGAPGSIFGLNSFLPYTQKRPRLASFPDGSFVAVWSSSLQDGSGWGVFGRLFEASGSPETDEFSVNTQYWGTQSGGAVATLDGGKFVTVWKTQSIFWGGPGHIHGQIFGPGGEKLAAPVD